MTRADELGPDTYLAWICSIQRTKDNPQDGLMICIAMQELPWSKPRKFVRLHPRTLYYRPRLTYEEKFRTRTIYALASGKPENSRDLNLPSPPKIGSGSLVVRAMGLDYNYVRPTTLAETSTSTWDRMTCKSWYNYKSGDDLAIFEFWSSLKGAKENFRVLFGFRKNRPFC